MSLAALRPALLCTAVEDITGHPCRRLACDGQHSWLGDDPWTAGRADEMPHREAARHTATTEEKTA